MKKEFKNFGAIAGAAFILLAPTLVRADGGPSPKVKPIYSRETLPTKPTLQELEDYKKVLNGMSPSRVQEEIHHWDNKISTCSFAGLASEPDAEGDLADLEEIRTFCKSATQYNEIAQKVAITKNSGFQQETHSNASSMDKVLPGEPEITISHPAVQKPRPSQR